MIEVLVSASLFVFQYIPVAGPWWGLMIFPLIIYVSGMIWSHSEFVAAQIDLLFISERLIFGRIVAVTGFMILLGACVQLLRGDGGVITTGFYSLVRHPQYLGISVMTLGVSVMCIQYTGSVDLRVLCVWLIQMLGYVLLAAYEERHLLNEYGREYHHYRQRVPFIFPCPCVMRIPEPLASMLIALIIAFLITFLA